MSHKPAFPIDELFRQCSKPAFSIDEFFRQLNKPAFSVDEFCRQHNIGRTTFYALLKGGNGPELMKVGKRTLITLEAAQRWRDRVTKQSQKGGNNE